MLDNLINTEIGQAVVAKISQECSISESEVKWNIQTNADFKKEFIAIMSRVADALGEEE